MTIVHFIMVLDQGTEGFVKGLNFEKILARTANNFSISNNGSHLGWDLDQSEKA